VSIVHGHEAGPLALPASSNARTKNVCGPSERGPTRSPLEQAENASASTWHSKLVPPAELKVNVVVEVPTTFGCETIVGTAGGLVSIVHAYGVISLSLPAASTARARRRCSPSPREYASGFEHGGKPGPSRLQWNVTLASLSEKLKLPDVWLLGFAGPAIVGAGGGTVSTVQVYEATSLGSLVSRSTALTSNVCDPSLRSE
jgi:hypothetical protein